MFAWYVMPIRAAATHAAALADLRATLDGLRCAVAVLGRRLTDPVDTEVLAVLDAELRRAARSLERLG